MLHDIALSLGLPLYKLYNEMPYEELVSWVNYFNRRPLGWRDDLRAFHIMRTFGDKRKPEQVFPSLIPLIKDDEEKTLAQKLKNSAMLSFMKAATNGDQLQVLNEI